MIQLFSYYRSSASYRIRIALHYKKLNFNTIPINLLHEEHLQEKYLQLNPQGRVPFLSDDQFSIGQSSAILEYLEECYPTPALLPNCPQLKAQVRYLSQIIISDMHPLNNSGTLNYLRNSFNFSETDIQNWYHHWLKKGFDCLETLISQQHTSTFCIGDTPTFVDICLIPQIYNAKRFNFSMTPYPSLERINDYCLSLDYFAKAHPEQQAK